MSIEQYGTAADGTPLHWHVVTDKGSAPRPAVLLLPGGEFKALANIPSIVGSDLNAAGFKVFTMTEYRIAPPNKLLGQTSNGRWPDQTNDVELAVAAAATDSRCNGEVFVVGGSAGGSHAAYLAAKRLVKAAACLSPAMQLDDPVSLQHTKFRNDVQNYAPDNLDTASPNNILTATSSPTFLVAFAQDNMPAPQYKLGLQRLVDLGAPHDSELLPGFGHSWDAWRAPNIPTRIISFLNTYRNATV